MRKANGSVQNIVKTEPVTSTQTTEAIALVTKQSDDSAHSVEIVLSRAAAINLFHQLNNTLFQPH